MTSRFEKNIALQPGLIKRILAQPAPAWAAGIRRRRVFFVGIGTSYFAAQIAQWLWRTHVGPDAHAAASFDFVKTPQPVAKGDVVAVFSHSGSKGYSTDAARLAEKLGAVTVGLTCVASSWKDGLNHRLQTCEREDTGAFTKSLTTALAWIVRLIDDEKLSAGMKKACASLEAGPPFPALKADADIILLGDAVREWVAREAALKIQEAARRRARAFGLEEFLHGPRLSAAPGSVVLGFSDRGEPRWNAARRALAGARVPLIEIGGHWLTQLFWGQRLTAELCRRLKIDPDAPAPALD